MRHTDEQLKNISIVDWTVNHRPLAVPQSITEMLLRDAVLALNSRDNFPVREGLTSYELAQAIQDYLTA